MLSPSQLLSIAMIAAALACTPAPEEDLGCDTDDECPSGMSCKPPGVCRADDPCADVTCEPGTACSDGTCRPANTCGAQNRVFPPAVLFVVDRSCSMAAELGTSGATKWEAAAAAISATATTLDDRLLFGLTVFPDTSGDRCEQTDVGVSIAAQSGAAIESLLLDALDPGDALFPDGPCVTNIDTAMSQAASLVGSGSLDAQVVLVSDGRQAQCNEATGEADAEGTIRTLYDLGVETVVVGFDRQADAAVLDTFARAGGRPNADADVDFYPATEPAALETTLLGLADDALDCAFRLREAPPDPSTLYVFIDEVSTDAFSYDPSSRVLTLLGAACDAVSGGDDARVDVIFGGCPD